jgi:hypothetical protein
MASDGKAVSYCYGRDYYMGLSPVSDVRAAIEICGFATRLLEAAVDLGIPRRTRDELRASIIELVKDLCRRQAEWGGWPLLTNEFYAGHPGASYGGFLISKDFPTFNISFNNTFYCLQLFGDILNLLQQRACYQDDCQQEARGPLGPTRCDVHQHELISPLER